MSFERPLLLFVLLLAPLAVLVYTFTRGRGGSYAVSFPNVVVLATVVDDRRRRSHLPAALWLVVLAMLGVAAAGPKMAWTVPVRDGTVVLAVDASRSMLSDDVIPTRLEAAKDAARVFVERVPSDFRVGIVVFAGDVAVTAMPTADRDVVTAGIDSIVPRESSGTAIGDALARSVELGQLSRTSGAEVDGAPSSANSAKNGPASILFLSDGRQEDGLLRPLEGSARAKAAGIPVYTVALGTEGGARQAGPTGAGFFYDNVGTFRVPDLDTMRTIAITTGGEFFEARTGEALKGAYEALGTRLGRIDRVNDVTVAFVAVAAVALLAAFLISASWWPRVP